MPGARGLPRPPHPAPPFWGRWRAPLGGPESPGPRRAGLREKLGDSGHAGCREPWAATSPGSLWLPVSQFPAPAEPFRGRTGSLGEPGGGRPQCPAPAAAHADLAVLRSPRQGDRVIRARDSRTQAAGRSPLCQNPRLLSRPDLERGQWGRGGRISMSVHRLPKAKIPAPRGGPPRI